MSILGQGHDNDDDRRITNLKSFEEVTENPRQIAALYFYQILDCLVDLAYQVSCDFVRRPQKYQLLGQPDITRTLQNLKAQYGTEFNKLSTAQRAEIYLPIFGHESPSPSVMPQNYIPVMNDTDSFSRLRDSLIRAATAFAGEPAVDTGVQMLRGDVRLAHIPFKDYLVGLHGDSVRSSKEALKELTENTCYPILRHPGVASVFGFQLKSPEDRNYPYSTDSNEDKLVAEICTQLRLGDNPPPLITTERISSLQRAALRGAEAIAAVIDFDETKKGHEHLEALIIKCYTWGTALASLDGYPNMAVSPMPPAAGSSATPTSSARPGAKVTGSIRLA